MWNDTDIPLAYLITFRTYGTWLHGDERGSVDREHNRYKSPYASSNQNRKQHNRTILKGEPVVLNVAQRASVERAIRDTCAHRKWRLHAFSVRTNHVHTVVSIGVKKPELSTVIHFTAVFTKPVTGFTNTDVTIGGTASATVANVSQIAPNDGTTYDVAIEGMTQSGTVIADIPANVASDTAGNLNTVGTFTDHTVTFFKDDFTTFEVNTTADTDDGSCDPLGTGPGNHDCTLREAINAANADAGAETITFNSVVFAAPGPYTINLTGALPDLSTDMTIAGPGANVLTVKRNTGGNYRIFNIPSGNVTIDGLTISNGNVIGNGGGIFDNSAGTVNVTNSTISGNSASVVSHKYLYNRIRWLYAANHYVG